MTDQRSSGDVAAFFSVLGRLRMLGGDPALDFANTRHWREGGEIDFLTGYAALVDWAVPAGLISEAEAARLHAVAAPATDEAASLANEAIALRDDWRAYLAARVGRSDRTVPAEILLDAVRRPVAALIAQQADWLVGIDAGEAPAALALPLARVAFAIAACLTLPRARVIRMGEADPCGGFFIDLSRSQHRRWCAMDSCGNRAKARRHRGRMVAEAVTP